MTSARTISVGLIGCGDVASRYVAAIKASSGAMRLEWVWDVDPAAGVRFASHFGIELASSLESLVASPLDLVCICTPNDTHASLAQRCLEAGRHVLLEHPLATRMADAERLCVLAAARGRNLFIMRQRRFLASVQILRRYIQEGSLGRVRNAQGFVCWNREPTYFAARMWRTRPENGGVVLNQASHFLDILGYLFGDPVAVSGVIGSIRPEIPVEDAFAGTIAFRGDVEVGFACTTAAPPGQNWSRLTVEGSRRRIVLSGKGWEALEDPDQSNVLERSESGAAELLAGDHAAYLDRVRRRLTGERVELVSAAEELRTLRLIESIYRTSAVDGQELSARFQQLFQRGGNGLVRA